MVSFRLPQAIGAFLLLAIRSFQRAEDVAMVVVEHRLRLIHPVIDRVVVMCEGHVVDDRPNFNQILNSVACRTLSSQDQPFGRLTQKEKESRVGRPGEGAV